MGNLKKEFTKFLKENVKSNFYDFNAYYNELIDQYYNTGSNHYELSKFKSKSGNPEIFDYNEEDLHLND